MTSRTTRRGLAAATGLLLAASGVLAAAPASASTRSLQLDYVCNFPLLKPERLSLSLSAEIPDVAAVGKPTGKFPIKATATVGPGAAKGLRALETATVEGFSVADVQFQLPLAARPLDLGVTVDVEKTTLPATGGFDVKATGGTPSINLPRVGTATITMQRGLLLTLMPRLADGTPTGLEEFETECLAEPGQNMDLGTILIQEGVADTTAPSVPGIPTGIATNDSISLAWPASTDAVGVTGYDVYKDGVKFGSTVPTPAATATGLQPDTEYRFSVRARDAAGNWSALSPELRIRTTKPQPQTEFHEYALTGTATVNRLTRGTVPLTGSVDSELDTASGEFKANLLLNKTRGRLVALGFIPLTADVAFIQSGQTTGKLTGSSLATTSLMKIRLPQVYLFGSVPIAGSGSCQSKRASEIKLTSGTTPFVPGTGGSLTGTFAISDLSGCGFLNGLISPLVAGGGNALSIKLTPQAGA